MCQALVHSYWHAIRICLPGQWDLLPIFSPLGICILILEPLCHAERINSSKAFILTCVWKALFLVISSNCCYPWLVTVGQGEFRPIPSLKRDALFVRLAGRVSGWCLLWGEDTRALYYLIHNGWDLALTGQGRRDKRAPSCGCRHEGRSRC